MVNSEIADADAPTKVNALNTVRGDASRRIWVRGKPIFLNLLETFPGRGNVAHGFVDEIHVQLFQSQLGAGQCIISRRYAEVRHLVRTDLKGLTYIRPRGIFGGDVEVGPVIGKSVRPIEPKMGQETLRVRFA